MDVRDRAVFNFGELYSGDPMMARTAHDNAWAAFAATLSRPLDPKTCVTPATSHRYPVIFTLKPAPRSVQPEFRYPAAPEEPEDSKIDIWCTATADNWKFKYQRVKRKLGKCGTVTLLVAISVVLGFALPVASIFVGAYYKLECPVERYIPIYLIVAGSGGLLCLSCSLTIFPRNDVPEDPEINAMGGFIGLFIALFLAIWLLVGNYWVFSVQYPTKEQCDPIVYIFTYVSIIVGDCILGVVLLAVLVSRVCACFK